MFHILWTGNYSVTSDSDYAGRKCLWFTSNFQQWHMSKITCPNSDGASSSVESIQMEKANDAMKFACEINSLNWSLYYIGMNKSSHTDHLDNYQFSRSADRRNPVICHYIHFLFSPSAIGDGFTPKTVAAQRSMLHQIALDLNALTPWSTLPLLSVFASLLQWRHPSNYVRSKSYFVIVASCAHNNFAYH